MANTIDLNNLTNEQLDAILAKAQERAKTNTTSVPAFTPEQIAALQQQQKAFASAKVAEANIPQINLTCVKSNWDYVKEGAAIAGGVGAALLIAGLVFKNS